MIADALKPEERFFVTYGDGLADVDIRDLLELHKKHGKLATMTTVHPRSPFGLVEIGEDGAVTSFREKPRLDVWINGGFFVFERDILDLLEGDPVLEEGPLETLAAEGELMAYRHTGDDLGRALAAGRPLDEVRPICDEVRRRVEGLLGSLFPAAAQAD